MGKQTKYKPSMGLAFNEENEMNMLKKMAAKGWKFYSYKFLGYKFKKSEPQELIYCVDIHKVKRDEKEQYFGLFEDAGWAHVCSAGDSIHYFSALPGTKPIYTDRDTLSEKYKKGTRDVIKATAAAVIVFFSSLLLNNYAGRLWKSDIISLILSMISGASIGLVIAFIITGIMLRLKSGRFQ